MGTTVVTQAPETFTETSAPATDTGTPASPTTPSAPSATNSTVTQTVTVPPRLPFVPRPAQ